MNEKQKSQIKERNAVIDNSIHLSKSREKDNGFKLFEKHIRLLEQNYRFPDVFTLSEKDAPAKMRAKVELCKELLNFLDHADTMAYKKKKDPETGEEEKLRE